jgi:hypothetical protein
MSNTTREAIVTAIQTFFDAELLGYYPINQRTISDIKDQDTKLYKRSIYIGGHQFHTRLGRLYDSMKKRCLVGGSCQRNQSYYLGTTMCDEWSDSFDSFAEWASTQIGMYQVDDHNQLFEIDKDLLGNGSKHYSPNTCTMLPKAINMALTANGSKGYRKTSSGKYSARITRYGKKVSIGTFDTEKQASAAYKKARRAYIRELAKKYKHQLSVVAYDALMSYKQA